MATHQQTRHLSQSLVPPRKTPIQKPDGQVVNDFYITTLADSVHIVPISKDNHIILIKIYKQGVDDIMIQFPAGRFESSKHQSLQEAALQELQEETGIKTTTDNLKSPGKLDLMTTKATECIHIFLAQDVSLNSTQQLDYNEDIEIIQLTPQEVDRYIHHGLIWPDAPCIAIWHKVKSTHPHHFTNTPIHKE